MSYTQHIKDLKIELRDKYTKWLNKYGIDDMTKFGIMNEFVSEMDILLNRIPIQVTRDYLDGNVPIRVNYRDWQINTMNKIK